MKYIQSAFNLPLRLECCYFGAFLVFSEITQNGDGVVLNISIAPKKCRRKTDKAKPSLTIVPDSYRIYGILFVSDLKP